MSEAAGLYVHLPFCVRRCSYCTFVLTTDFSSRDRYLAALRREASIVASEANGARFDTLYLGGGTPSAIPAARLADLVEDLRGLFSISEGAEVTFEANPDDVSQEAVETWRASGATRVSLGIQSLRDEELRAIERIHSAADARRALAVLLASGPAVSADLMIGIPGQRGAGFLSDVEELAATPLGHVSVYVLELDKAKPMEEDRRRRPGRYLSDDEQAEAYLAAGARLAEAGFEHDEVSNWSRPGCRAVHNRKYWTRAPTRGLGVGAHELWNERRRANTSSLGAYLDAIEHGRRPTAEDRAIDPVEREREEIMLGARTAEGVAAERIDGWMRERADDALRADWDQWLGAGFVVRRGDRYVLTEKGFLVSSEILCRFI